jgi:hypothetical protein
MDPTAEVALQLVTGLWAARLPRIRIYIRDLRPTKCIIFKPLNTSFITVLNYNNKCHLSLLQLRRQLPLPRAVSAFDIVGAYGRCWIGWKCWRIRSMMDWLEATMLCIRSSTPVSYKRRV